MHYCLPINQFVQNYPMSDQENNSKLIYLAASALEVFSNRALYKLTYSFIHSRGRWFDSWFRYYQVVTSWTGDCLHLGIKPTPRSTQPSILPRKVNRVPVCLAGVKQSTFACVGWQLTLCDPMRQVMLRNSVMGFPLKAIHSKQWTVQAAGNLAHAVVDAEPIEQKGCEERCLEDGVQDARNLAVYQERQQKHRIYSIIYLSVPHCYLPLSYDKITSCAHDNRSHIFKAFFTQFTKIFQGHAI